jgi:hypothetical protein
MCRPLQGSGDNLLDDEPRRSSHRIGCCGPRLRYIEEHRYISFMAPSARLPVAADFVSCSPQLSRLRHHPRPGAGPGRHRPALSPWGEAALGSTGELRNRSGSLRREDRRWQRLTNGRPSRTFSARVSSWVASPAAAATRRGLVREGKHTMNHKLTSFTSTTIAFITAGACQSNEPSRSGPAHLHRRVH